MNPFTLNGRKAGGYGTVTSKPLNGAVGSMQSTSKPGSSGAGAVSGAGTLQVPISTGSMISSINGDKTPQKKKISSSATMGVGAITSTSAGTKKVDGGIGSSSKLGTGSSGNVLGYSTGINQ